jgi:chromosomal replication initiator protein
MPRSRNDQPPAIPFLVLPENRFAFEAISSIGEGRPRPIYLYGPSGMGKSHLARHAVHLFLSRQPGVRVQHLTAADFAADFAEAASNRTVPLFQTATRTFDLFILEDLQVLDRRPETQVQLLALCNDLTAAGCQMLWTSRDSPGDMAGYLKKLVSRFRGGILARLQAPGRESRRKLLAHFAGLQHLRLSEEAAQLLAAELAVSPRELWSVVVQLKAVAQQRQPMSSDLVRRFLRQEIIPRKPRLDEICRLVARQFGVSASQLRSRRQARGVVLPRQCAMLLARQVSGRSLTQIGEYFGGRDHSTVIHACRRMASLLSREADLRLQLLQIEAALLEFRL